MQTTQIARKQYLSGALLQWDRQVHASNVRVRLCIPFSIALNSRQAQDIKVLHNSWNDRERLLYRYRVCRMGGLIMSGIDVLVFPQMIANAREKLSNRDSISLDTELSAFLVSCIPTGEGEPSGEKVLAVLNNDSIKVWHQLQTGVDEHDNIHNKVLQQIVRHDRCAYGYC